MVYKWCVVTQCKNTSIKTPQKVFVSVPTNPERRKIWLELSRRDPNSIVSHSNVFMCEDHFDMEKVTTNYLKYKMGFTKKIFLTDDAVPTKFPCQEEPKIQLSDSGPSINLFLNRRRLDVIPESLQNQTTAEILSNLQKHNYLEMIQSQVKMDMETTGIFIKKEPEKHYDENFVSCQQPTETEVFIKSELIEEDFKEFPVENDVLRIKSEVPFNDVSIKDENLHSEIDIKEENSNQSFATFPEENLQNGNEISTEENHLKNELNCRLCPKTFNDETLLEIHIRTHTADKSYTCDICSKTFPRLNELKSHSLTHSGEKTYACHMCEKVYGYKSSLKEHILTHSGIKPHSCDVCLKSFSHKSTLKMHRLVHTAEKSHVCQICSRSFSRKAHLETHMLIHTGDKPFSCEICKKPCRNKSELIKHMHVHDDVRKYVCEICQKSFQLRSHLNQHQAVHTGEKLFHCLECDKSFKTRSNLFTHKKIHGVRIKKEKNFICTICNKGFCDNPSLTRHMLVHTNEKPYECDFCKMQFKHKLSFMRHQSWNRCKAQETQVLQSCEIKSEPQEITR